MKGRVNVRVERSSTLTFTRVKFTCVRTEELRDSGNQPLAAPMYVRSWKKRFAQKTINSITHGIKS